MIGVEAAGHGLETGQHAASLTAGHVGVLHGNKTYLLQNETGRSSRSPLDLGRARLSGRRSRAQLPARQRPRARTRRSPTTRRSRRSARCAEHEGIIPALESAHAIAARVRLAPTLPRRTVVLVNLSGRGDKDMETVAEYLGLKFYCRRGDPARALSPWRPAGSRRRSRGSRRRGAPRSCPSSWRAIRDLEATRELLRAAVDAGADLIELGVPFSDPMADGPVLQRSAERALAAGTTLTGVLELVREFRARLGDPDRALRLRESVPGYGAERLADAAASGRDGVLCVDFPPEEADDLASSSTSAGSR